MAPDITHRQCARRSGQHHPRPLAALCPELNPIENVWEYLRGNKLAITVFNDYDDIADKTCNAWNFFANDPDRIASITTPSWQRSIPKALGISAIPNTLLRRSKVSCALNAIRVLVTLIEAWEAKHYPPDPIETIKYHMEQKGLGTQDLISFVGGRNRVYEILARKRPLILKMIQRLHGGLGIPAESLIGGAQSRAA